MAHSERWAKRLLGRLLGRLPADPEEILECRSFADPTFLRLYLDWVDKQSFNDPQKALKWAEVAPRLALKVPEDAGPEGRQAHREDLARAHVILGGAYRATSRFDDSEEQFEIAVRLAESEAIRPTVRVFLNQRLSYLRAYMGRPDEALRLCDEALEIQGRETCTERSDTLVRRGYALAELGRFAEAVACFGDALRGLDPKESTVAKWTHYGAIHNLAYALPKTKQGDGWTALGYVRKARELLKGQRLSLWLHKLNWVEGLAWRHVGMEARAEQCFQVARRGFIRLGVPWEIALVSLDLCALHRDCGEWSELETLAADTYRRFRELSGNTQAIAALSLCVDAARAGRGVKAAIAAARELVEARMARPWLTSNVSRAVARTSKPPRKPSRHKSSASRHLFRSHEVPDSPRRCR